VFGSSRKNNGIEAAAQVFDRDISAYLAVDDKLHPFG
jgi:hypothetical protein